MLHTLFNTLRRIVRDIVAGRNIEAYAIALVAFVMAVLVLLSDALPPSAQMAVLLAGVGLLVFRATSPPPGPPDLDAVLQDRQSYGPFREFIRGGRELWIYGPSAVNVLTSSADIEAELLTRGGSMRVLLQDPSAAPVMEVLARQLDNMSILLAPDIDRSLKVLHSLQAAGRDVQHRLLDYSPGFSMVIVDPHGRNGRLVVEFFGFGSSQIIERMHITIARQQSQYWFEYWVGQYELMWQHGREASSG